MRVWLIKAGEALPIDRPKDRLKRMGMLAEKLETAGHNVTWFNSSFNHSKKVQRCGKDLRIEVSNNYHIQLIYSNSYKNVSMARVKHHIETAKKFKNIAYSIDKPDIILCSMPTIELAEEAVNYGIENNVPVVIDIRDLWPDIYTEAVPPFVGTLIKPYVIYSRNRLKMLLSKAFAITGLTYDFVNWGLYYADRPATEYDRIFNMAYKRESTNCDNPYEVWDILNPSDFVVCFFGNLGRQFNFAPIIETAKKLVKEKDIKFVICGTGELLPDLTKKTESIGNVILPGWVSVWVCHFCTVRWICFDSYRTIFNSLTSKRSRPLCSFSMRLNLSLKTS
jgi:glycosyltransferase involved in cell wall biosynthesis